MAPYERCDRRRWRPWQPLSVWSVMISPKLPPTELTTRRFLSLVPLFLQKKRSQGRILASSRASAITSCGRIASSRRRQSLWREHTPRTRADYDALAELDTETATDLLDNVQVFVEATIEEITERGKNPPG